MMTHLLTTAIKSARTNESRCEISVKAIKFIDVLTGIERFDEALALAAAVEAQASRIRDTELRRQVVVLPTTRERGSELGKLFSWLWSE